MKDWFISIIDNSEKRAKLSVIVGAASIVLGFAAIFITFLAYSVSALLAVASLLMGYTSLESKRGWHAVGGMILGGLGLIGPLAMVAVIFFSLGA